MRRLRVVATEFEGVVGLDRTTDVHRPAVVERPATVSALTRTQVIGELRFQVGFRLPDEMQQQNVFGRDRAVGLELETPVAVGLLAGKQAGNCLAQRGLDLVAPTAQGVFADTVRVAALGPLRVRFGPSVGSGCRYR